MHGSTAIITFMCGVVGFTSAPPPSNAELGIKIDIMLPRLTGLEKEVRDLKNRVHALENLIQSGHSPLPGQSPLPTASSSTNVMVVEGFEQALFGEQALEEASRLDEAAVKLESTVRFLKKEISQLTGRDIETKRKNRKKTAEMSKYDRSARTKRAKALRLRKNAEEMHQIIYGWNGNRNVVLVTKRDLSHMLTKIASVGFIEWNGSRTRMTEEIVEFSVSNIKIVSRPPNFVDRP